MSFDGQRLAINGDPMVQQEAGQIVFSRYVLQGVHLPRNVWTGLDKGTEPDNLRPINTIHLGPDSIFTAPPAHQISVYEDGGLTELFGIIERERIFELGLSTIEDLVAKSQRIIPKVEVKVTRIFNRKERMPEDVIAEFLKRQEGVDVNLVGRGWNCDRLIMKYKLGYADRVLETPKVDDFDTIQT